MAEDGERRAPRGAFLLDGSKLAGPRLRDGLIERTELVERLRATDGVRVARIGAPAGYGKTTLLGQWEAADERPFAWLSLDRRDNDPVVFLTYLAAAVDAVAPIDRDVFADLARTPGSSLWMSAVPLLAGAVERAGTPLVLALDDDHELEAQDCIDALAMLARQLPDGSLLALAGRGSGSVPLARLRANGDLLELGPEQLALVNADARALLRGAGLELSSDDASALNARAEGWAGGLYLAALALRDAEPEALHDAFAGDDRFVTEYLRAEHLGRLPPELQRFLRRSSVLERMSAPLCDAVLEVSDSARMLEELERDNLFVVPLDRGQRWFRYHHLFRDALRAELERSEPEAVEGLHRRAAAWLEANGMPDLAIDHCHAAGDVDGEARLVATYGLLFYRTGRAVTAASWFERFDDPDLLARYPAVAGLGTWMHTLRGRTDAANRWAASVEASTYDGPMPDGSPSVPGWIALVRTILCRGGVEQMRRDAEAALAGMPGPAVFHAPAAALGAVGAHLAGHADGEALLQAAAGECAAAGAVFAGAIAHAELALIALDRADDARAERELAAAQGLVAHAPVLEYSPAALMVAARARLLQRQGRTADAREQLTRAQLMRPLLTMASSWLAVQVRLELAATHAALADVEGARTLLWEAREVLAARPGLGRLEEQAEALGDRLAQMSASGGGWAATLTAAELRLLPYLTTHLSFAEIGARLYVSRNTVKTQAVSMYRKLGVSSRSEAVARAGELGLLDDVVVRRYS